MCSVMQNPFTHPRANRQERVSFEAGRAIFLLGVIVGMIFMAMLT